MLARTFLTAKQLKISEMERQAALKLLNMLERGELQYKEIERDVCYCPVGFNDNGPIMEEIEYMLPHDSGLNMAWWAENRAGPFVGCLGGWMERIKGRSLSDRCIHAWDDLFSPICHRSDPGRYTPERCARALHAKLTTGEAAW